uniref:Uncharacterized protein n=1 Tax=Aegilops tauschii TaxID=37682 RepID=M8BU04_AEGTA
MARFLVALLAATLVAVMAEEATEQRLHLLYFGKLVLTANTAACVTSQVQAGGQLGHAAPATAEVFWRAVLPHSPLPDAVLRLLKQPAAEHVSFKLLGTKPGGTPVCHLMPYGHIIWAKNVKRSTA